MPAAWTYSDWITKASASAERLERLRLHIQEVANAMATGDYTITGRQVQKYYFETYLKGLKNDEQREAAATDVAQGTRLGWSRGLATS